MHTFTSTTSAFTARSDLIYIIPIRCYLLNVHHAHHHMHLASLAGFFVFGLLTSLHCIGMCGPLSSILCQTNRTELWVRVGTYHFVRIFSYTVVGALLAVFGHYVQNVVPFSFMVWLVTIPLLLYALGLFLPTPTWLTAFHKLALAKLRPNNGLTLSVLLGALSPLLPCGMLYSAFAASLAASSAWQGGFWMMAFATGTVPLLLLAQLGIGKTARFGNGKYATTVLRLSALFAVGFIFWMQFH